MNQTSTSYSSISESGLKLEIHFNATTFTSGYSLGLQIYLVNTLDQNLTLPTNWSTNPTIANWDLNNTLCGLSAVAHTFGFVIFKGHYAESNISKATNQLMLAPLVTFSCPNRFYNAAYIQKVQFQPNGYRATFLANSSFSNVFKAEKLIMLINATTEDCGASPSNGSGSSYSGADNTTTYSSGTELAFWCGAGSDGIDGYWTRPANHIGFFPNIGMNGTPIDQLSKLHHDYFHPLGLGSYTVLAEDIWNQTVLGYFQVISPSASSFSNLTCNSTFYDLITSANTSVHGSYTFVTQTAYISTSETNFTTTTNETRSSGYVSTTTEYYPPNSRSVEACTFDDG